MKRVLIPTIIFSILFLTACAQPPQVTLTRSAEETVILLPTETPIPTPTLHPQFTALQAKFNTGERFSLNSDGTVSDGEGVVAGITVTPEGKVMVTVDGVPTEVDTAKVHLDDEKGVTVDGFVYDDTDGWKELTSNLVDVGGGLSVVLGEKVDGGTVIDKFVADSSLTPEQQAEKIAYTDYTRVGYEQGDLLWMQNEQGKTVLVDATDHESIIAEFKRAKNAGGTTEVVWNWDKMIDPETGESILFSVEGIKTFDLNRYGIPIDNDSLLRFRSSIRSDEVKEFAELHGAINYASSDGVKSSLNRDKVIGYVFSTLETEGFASDSSDGTLFFGVNDEVKRIYVANFAFTNIDMLTE